MHVFVMYRLWSHRAENALRKSDDYLLRNPRHSSDAALSVQYRRHNGALVPLPVLADLLLRLHTAAEERSPPSCCAQEGPQFQRHRQVSRVRYTFNLTLPCCFQSEYCNAVLFYRSGSRTRSSRTSSLKKWARNQGSQRSADSALAMSETLTHSYSDTECR